MRFTIALVSVALCASATAAPRKKNLLPPPIVRVQAPAPLDETYGAWKVGALGDGVFYATTANQADSVLGVFCDAKTCRAYFNPHVKCDDKSTYPLLANSAAGAYHITAICAHFGTTPVVTFATDRLFVDAMGMGGEYGLVFPMASGEFQVSRFSMVGGMKAAQRVANLAGTADAQIANGPTDSKI